MCSPIFANSSTALLWRSRRTIREGGIIREGFNAELDEVKSDMTNGKQLIAELEARERSDGHSETARGV